MRGPGGSAPSPPPGAESPLLSFPLAGAALAAGGSGLRWPGAAGAGRAGAGGGAGGGAAVPARRGRRGAAARLQVTAGRALGPGPELGTDGPGCRLWEGCCRTGETARVSSASARPRRPCGAIKSRIRLSAVGRAWNQSGTSRPERLHGSFTAGSCRPAQGDVPGHGLQTCAPAELSVRVCALKKGGI